MVCVFDNNSGTISYFIVDCCFCVWLIRCCGCHWFHGDNRTIVTASSAPNVITYHIRLRGVVWEADTSLYRSRYGSTQTNRNCSCPSLKACQILKPNAKPLAAYLLTCSKDTQMILRGPNFWPKARFILMWLNPFRSAAGHLSPSNPTTTWAGCPKKWVWNWSNLCANCSRTIILLFVTF